MLNTRLLLLALLLVSVVLLSGCGGPPQVTTYISKDPAACKTLNFDCSEYGKTDPNFKSNREFSDETGCGCIVVYKR